MLDILENLILHGTCWGDVCSGGLIGIFGNPLFLGLAAMLFVIGLGMVLRLNIDIMILTGILILLILGGEFLPQWAFYLAVIGAAILVGLMIKRVIGR